MEIEYNRNDPVDDSLHIISMVVMARPHHVSGVKKSILDIDGGEIHASDDKGKFVVTFEAPNNKALTQRMDQLQAIEHIVSSLDAQHKRHTLSRQKFIRG